MQREAGPNTAGAARVRARAGPLFTNGGESSPKGFLCEKGAVPPASPYCFPGRSEATIRGSESRAEALPDDSGPRIAPAGRPGRQGWRGAQDCAAHSGAFRRGIQYGGLRRAGSENISFFRYFSLTRQLPRPISAPSTPEVRLPRPVDALSKRSERRSRREPARFPARRRRSAIRCAIHCTTGLDGRTPSGSTLRFRRAVLLPILPGDAAPGVERRSRSAGDL